MSFGQIVVSLLSGFGNTLLLFAITLVFSLPLGFILCFGLRSTFKPLKYLLKGIIWVIRGTPLMLQLIIIFYMPGLWFGSPVFSDNRLFAASVAFVINYACYFAEIFRGGFESIPKGQYEACKVLGMTRTQTFFKVVLLQIIKNVVAPLGNEVVTLVKDTSLANIIMLEELILKAQNIEKTYGILEPLFIAGLFYLIFNSLVQFLLSKTEKKLAYYKV